MKSEDWWKNRAIPGRGVECIPFWWWNHLVHFGSLAWRCVFPESHMEGTNPFESMPIIKKNALTKDMLIFGNRIERVRKYVQRMLDATECDCDWDDLLKDEEGRVIDSGNLCASFPTEPYFNVKAGECAVQSCRVDFLCLRKAIECILVNCCCSVQDAAGVAPTTTTCTPCSGNTLETAWLPISPTGYFDLIEDVDYILPFGAGSASFKVWATYSQLVVTTAGMHKVRMQLGDSMDNVLLDSVLSDYSFNITHGLSNATFSIHYEGPIVMGKALLSGTVEKVKYISEWDMGAILSQNAEISPQLPLENAGTVVINEPVESCFPTLDESDNLLTLQEATLPAINHTYFGAGSVNQATTSWADLSDVIKFGDLAAPNGWWYYIKFYDINLNLYTWAQTAGTGLDPQWDNQSANLLLKIRFGDSAPIVQNSRSVLEEGPGAFTYTVDNNRLITAVTTIKDLAIGLRLRAVDPAYDWAKVSFEVEGCSIFPRAGTTGWGTAGHTLTTSECKVKAMLVNYF